MLLINVKIELFAVKRMTDFQLGGKKAQEAGLRVLKVSSIPAFIFLMWNYSSLLINFYFFAGEICALKSHMDLKSM